jgi:phage shock protein C
VDDRLYRSRTDRLLAGVCGGLADRLALDPSLVRIGWVLLTLVSGGIFFILYIVMAIIVPEAPAAGWPTTPPAPGPGAVPGWNPPTTGVGAAAAAGGVAGATAAQTGMPASPEAAAGGWQPPAQPAAPTPAPTWSAAPPPPHVERERRGGAAVLVIGLGFILLGGWLFLRPYIPDFGIELRSLWPLAVIILGVVLVIAAVRPGGSRRD